MNAILLYDVRGAAFASATRRQRHAVKTRDMALWQVEIECVCELTSGSCSVSILFRKRNCSKAVMTPGIRDSSASVSASVCFDKLTRAHSQNKPLQNQAPRAGVP